MTSLNLDPRLGSRMIHLSFDEFLRRPPSKKTGILICSYPDDEGVRLNKGRPGAAQGPERILQYLSKMILQELSPLEIFVINDSTGGVMSSLADRHREAEARLLEILNRGYRAITLGGGHDYGYPDASAFYQKFKSNILNVDAHLDVRPVEDERLNSGTPFFRFAERFGGKPIIQYGIQPQCNAEAHRAYARKMQMKIISLGEKLPPLKAPLGLSIDLDAFENIRGVSAPAMVGLSTREGLSLVQKFAGISPWMGLYESAPTYDPQNEDSARFAALLAYHFIHSKWKSSAGKRK